MKINEYLLGKTPDKGGWVITTETPFFEYFEMGRGYFWAWLRKDLHPALEETNFFCVILDGRDRIRGIADAATDEYDGRIHGVDVGFHFLPDKAAPALVKLILKGYSDILGGSYKFEERTDYKLLPDGSTRWKATLKTR